MESYCLYSLGKSYYSNKEHKKKFLAPAKTYRLQQLYNAALNSLKEVQNGKGVTNITLQLGKKQKYVSLKIPLMFIIGDNQGGDTICGQSIYYGKGALRISRMCNAGPDEIAYPEYGACQRILMEDVKQMIINHEYQSLFNMYQAQHWIAWFDIDYRGNPEGIFTAACPPEALHALENGIIHHLLKEVFQQNLNVKSCSLLDDLCSNWNNYPGQHYMQSHSTLR